MNHLRVLRSLQVDLFVCDTDPVRLQGPKLAGVRESHLTTDISKFSAQVDAVIIVTPAQTHFPLGLDLLAMGKDVFIEKPLALTADEAKQLALMAQMKKRILQVGHIFRFDPASGWLAFAINQGRFGRIHMIRGRFGGFKRPRNDSGVLFADGIHFIDLYNYFLRALPKSVLAIQHDFIGRGMEDVSFVSLEYETDLGTVWATVDNDYQLPGKSRDIVIVGEKLSAVCDYNAGQNKIKLFENRRSRTVGGLESIEGAVTSVECSAEEPLVTELRAFLDSVLTRQKPRAGGWEGYEAVRVIEAAMASAKTGQKIMID
jgi:UDP-2-acetamido-3-amino-2,3-dideoxy-glucuronate N-acetyltransferase